MLPYQTQKKLNKQWHGYLLGVVLPIIALVFMYFILAREFGFIGFLKYLAYKGDLSRALSLSVLPNLGLFFVFIWTNRLKAAQGVLGSTIILALMTVTIRFI